MAVEQLSENDLAELLPEEPDEFLRFLHVEYGEQLIACIGKHSYDLLDIAELEDVYQKTLIQVWNKIRKPDFDCQAPLRIVFTIAKRRAIDARRRKTGRRRVVNETELQTQITDFVISDVEGSNLRIDWKLADEEEKRRLKDALPEIIAELPDRQRAAATAFLECYEEIRPKNLYKPMARSMGKLLGEDVSVDAAKSAWRGAMEKIRNQLIRRKIGFLEGSDL